MIPCNGYIFNGSCFVIVFYLGNVLKAREV